MITLFDNFKFYKNGLNITYSAVVLDQNSKNLLLSTFIYSNPDYLDWIKLADHMTICLGELPEHVKRYWLDEEITLKAIEIGVSDKAIAVKVDGFFNISKNFEQDDEIVRFPHVTIAINSFDAKPVDSNNITNWQIIEPLKLKGIIKEVLR